ncbi:EVE domain-containing protein [Alsobacter sp. KACC 23698]|uniref:UPF0310 protein ABEG18_11720 n=1 Tax=Alsobacter sp. KACC 23698 TaxID=3149229 RepID=A0AAU7JLU1_9HYPH
MSRFWIGVASAEHVRRGSAGGFMQLCHGKAAPLRRIAPGDGVVYYSPSEAFGARDGYSSLTAVGWVRAGDAYDVDCGNGFRPHRRDVDWWDARETPIRPLLDALDFTRGQRNWGYRLRFGVFEISERDYRTITEAMGAAGLTPAGSAPPPPR